MSITAFPVLARILAERRLTRTDLGAMAIACAAIDDVTAWCILAYIVAFVRSTESSHLWITFVGVTVFAVAMIFVVRGSCCAFQAAFAARHKLTEDMMALLLCCCCCFSAAATEFLGVHLLFGAFLFGAVLPRDHDFVRAVSEKLESVTVVLLLPCFSLSSDCELRCN
jgi:Kef-type K+ transport system membrane component KefB